MKGKAARGKTQRLKEDEYFWRDIDTDQSTHLLPCHRGKLGLLRAGVGTIPGRLTGSVSEQQCTTSMQYTATAPVAL